MHSIFELFKVGLGPSSSHTVGPMVAAYRFASSLGDSALETLIRVQVELFGSLALTGKGHATDSAVLGGLSGLLPDQVDPDRFQSVVQTVRDTNQIALLGRTRIPFDESQDLIFHQREMLPRHSNGMRFTATFNDRPSVREIYYSVGGGFVMHDSEFEQETSGAVIGVPFDFRSATELLQMCEENGLTIADLVHANERTWRNDDQIGAQLDLLWSVMESCIERGCNTAGILPGGLGVKRRAPGIYQKLKEQSALADPLRQLDWVSLFALAVNEENAAGGKVVTAPTNGAAGVIPAVLAYYVRFVPGANRAGIHCFLKTAGAIGLLYKLNASLSAAEMGCQGEVGVACSMAAAGLAACLNGTNEQIENAAEIGMEHNLGLTCDPVRGLVQVPCIERNTMGATKAINAARLAVLYGDGSHRVSLDKVIETMRQTGVDMQSKYKETSLGGLAVNVVNC